MHLSFQRIFYALAVVIALIWLMIIGKAILIPLAFAMMISFILFPIARWLEKLRLGRIFAAFLAMLLFFGLMGGGIYFFSANIAGLSGDFSSFKEKLMQLFSDVLVVINQIVPLSNPLDKTDILLEAKQWLSNSSAQFVSNTFNSTATFLTQLLGVFIYTFLILIDRDGLTRAFLAFASEEKRPKVLDMYKNVRKVGQQYLWGVLLVVLILGVLNSLGLWIIGLENPFLFGFMAASLSIIPYVGTTVGASIPVLYAFMTHDSFWMPLAVAILFWAVQLLESNFLSPKIVGASVRINALASIVSLIVGAMVWGVAGMVLFLPFTAILRVISEEYAPLKPIALLVGMHEDDSGQTHSSWVVEVRKKVVSWIKKKPTTPKK